MAKLFDYINSINKKEYLWSSDDDNVEYNAFVANKAFSYFKDTILYANELNQLNRNLNAKQSYDFYYHALPKGKRYSKWYKKTIDDNDVTVIEMVARFYEVNPQLAAEMIEIITPEQLENLVQTLSKGGKEL